MRIGISPLTSTFIVKTAFLIFLILPTTIARSQDGQSCLAAISVDNNAADQITASIARYSAALDNNQCTLQLTELREQLRLTQLRLYYLGPTNAACVGQTVTGGNTADQFTKKIADLLERIKSDQDDCTSADASNAGAAVCFTAGVDCDNYVTTNLNSCTNNCASSTGMQCWKDCQIRGLQQTEQCGTAMRTCEANRLKSLAKEIDNRPPFIPPIKCFGLCPQTE